jgi:hypothetical protein
MDRIDRIKSKAEGGRDSFSSFTAAFIIPPSSFLLYPVHPVHPV